MLSVKVLKKYLISPPPLTAHNTMHIHHKALGSFQYTAAGIVLAFSVHVRHILAETWTEFILQKYGLLGTIVEVVVVQARNSISSQDQTYMKGSFQTPNAAEKIIVIISSFSVCQKDKLKRIFHLFFARVIISLQDSFKAQRLRNKDFPTAAKIFIRRAAEWVNVENTVYSSIGQTTDFYTLPVQSW